MATTDTSYGSLPFREQIEFFRRKLNLPTEGWTDIYNAEHDYAFVVAGANRDDLLADLRRAVESAINDGTTLETFRQEFATIVEKYGWSYNGGFGWRTRVIYDTNLRSSYQAGRYQQLMSLRESMPFWEYLHDDAVEHPRLVHVGWNGMVLRWDDPWWAYYFPPNGWGCQCTVRGRSQAWMRRNGKSGPDTAPAIVFEDKVIGQRSPGGPRVVSVPQGIDPSFEHIPGRSRLDGQVPPPQSTPPDATPPSRPAQPDDVLPPPQRADSGRRQPAGTPLSGVVSQFLETFGATPTTPAVFRDVTGTPLVIGQPLFTDAATGELTLPRQGLGRYLLLLADAIRQPDEIWTRMEWAAAVKAAIVRRSYIARFSLEGESTPVTIAYDTSATGWTAQVLGAEDEALLNALRSGQRVYQRQE